MLVGPKDKRGLVYSTNIRGYSIKINNSEIKVLGYEPYRRTYGGSDSNEMREFDANEVLRLIASGKLAKSNGLRR
jgi:hypothetical protein